MTGVAPGMGVCGTCGGPMDLSRATYDKNGNLQCPQCSARTQIEEGDQRAGASVVGSAVGVLIGGILSVTCFNPMLIVSLVTTLSGVSWLIMVGKNPQLRAKMGGKLIGAMIAAIIGTLLAAFPLVLVGLAALGFAVGSAMR